MDDRDEAVFSHLGVCVSDLGASLRFYCEALGFERAERHEIGQDFAALMELDRVALTSQFVRRGPTAIELLAFAEPRPEGTAHRRPVHRLGLTHLSFRVRDVAAVARRIAEFGGAVVAPTMTSIELGPATLEFVYCTDPDGVRIELMHLGD